MERMLRESITIQLISTLISKHVTNISVKIDLSFQSEVFLYTV